MHCLWCMRCGRAGSICSICLRDMTRASWRCKASWSVAAKCCLSRAWLWGKERWCRSKLLWAKMRFLVFNALPDLGLFWLYIQEFGTIYIQQQDLPNSRFDFVLPIFFCSGWLWWSLTALCGRDVLWLKTFQKTWMSCFLRTFVCRRKRGFDPSCLRGKLWNHGVLPAAPEPFELHWRSHSGPQTPFGGQVIFDPWAKVYPDCDFLSMRAFDVNEIALNFSDNQHGGDKRKTSQQCAWEKQNLCELT